MSQNSSMKPVNWILTAIFYQKKLKVLSSEFKKCQKLAKNYEKPLWNCLKPPKNYIFGQKPDFPIFQKVVAEWLR